jgi:hypothetical protein
LVERLPYLLPIHIHALMGNLLKVPDDHWSSDVLQLLTVIGIHQSCTQMVCDFLFKQLNAPQADILDILGGLYDFGIIPALCSAISDFGPECPASVRAVVCHAVINFAAPDRTLVEHCQEIMGAILNGRVIHDGLIIAAHFARLPGEFVGDMLQAGLIPYIA